MKNMKIYNLIIPWLNINFIFHFQVGGDFILV